MKHIASGINCIINKDDMNDFVVVAKNCNTKFLNHHFIFLRLYDFQAHRTKCGAASNAPRTLVMKTKRALAVINSYEFHSLVLNKYKNTVDC